MPNIDFPMSVSNGGTTMEQITSLQEVLGAVLPPDYVEFLLAHNGGEPEKVDFAFEDEDGNEEGSTLELFYGVDNADDDLEQTWQYYLEQERIPPGYLPIAGDVCGNMLLLSISKESSGSVFFWDHEKEHLEGEEMLSFVAGSFSDFLELLK